jgi:hypothetical protein
MAETAKKNVYQRINAIRESNEYIKKKKTVDNQYKVVTHDQVTAEIRDDLIKHGVVIEPHCTGERTIQDTLMFGGAKKNPIIRLETSWDIHFVNIDDPKDRAIVQLPAHALDTGDKAPGKAVSYAVKAAILKIFAIETGEDDEERKEKDAVGDSITVNQFTEFVDLINALPESSEIDKHAQSLWENILKACEKVKDKSSATKLRSRLTAKVTAIRKGLKKGAANAQVQH